jgi:hypothetical protein
MTYQDRAAHRGYIALQRRAAPLPLSAGPLNIADWNLADPGDWERLFGAAIHYMESRQRPLTPWRHGSGTARPNSRRNYATGRPARCCSPRIAVRRCVSRTFVRIR